MPRRNRQPLTTWPQKGQKSASLNCVTSSACVQCHETQGSIVADFVTPGQLVLVPNHWCACYPNTRKSGVSEIRMFGAIEAGGTKFVCSVGTGPADLETIQIPTTSPAATIGGSVAFLRGRAGADRKSTRLNSSHIPL